MDGERFDALARQLNIGRTRRGVLGALLAAASGLPAATEQIDARGRKGKRRRQGRGPRCVDCADRPLTRSADLKGYSYLAIPLHGLGTVFAANRLLAATIALALGTAFYLYLRTSLAGKAVRALMQEPEGAQLVGIRTSRVHALCFGAGIAMSAVTGSLVSMLFELTPFMGLPYTVTALVVVILGGLGNMMGCLLAGLLLGLVETAGVYLASSDIRLISSYAVLSLILILRPSGLFGR